MGNEKPAYGAAHSAYGPPQQIAQPPVYSASPHPPPGGRRLLHIYHPRLSRRHIEILDADKSTPLYSIQSNRGGILSSKPNMTIVNATTGAVIGTVSFRSFSSVIDVQVHGRDIIFARNGMFTTVHKFCSIASGQEFTWQREGMFSGGDLKCTDQRGQLVMTFESSLWAASKDGKLELAPTIQGPLMDELVVTGIAFVEYRRRQRRAGAAGGASGGGAC